MLIQQCVRSRFALGRRVEAVKVGALLGDDHPRAFSDEDKAWVQTLLTQA